MLTDLHVKNLALIKDAELHFRDGLNVLSGETGAGKSILLNSILLALGKRADSELIRSGEESAYVELIFTVETDALREKLEAYGVTAEDGQVIMSRRIFDKKSVAKMNGETVPLSLLKSVAECFIEVYGQKDAITLLSPENHLKILNHYGKTELKESLSKYRQCYHDYKDAKKALTGIIDDPEEAEKRLDFLRFVTKEIDDAGIRPGEEQEVRETLKREYSGGKVKEGLEGAAAALSDSVSTGLSEALTSLKTVLQSLPGDEKISGFYGVLQDTDSVLNDVLQKILTERDNCEIDEALLAKTEARLDTILTIQHKYGGDFAALSKLRKEYGEELLKLENLLNNREKLENDLAVAKENLISAAETLHNERLKVADRFSRAVEESLRDFRFLSVSFQAPVTETNRFTEDGRDEVNFMISTNPGEKEKPLSDVASGGELSRIMLAIKTLSVNAEEDAEKVLIFDEVDQGISGLTATAVGRKLRTISAGHQIVLVSHLPQIVATADHHYLIDKGVTESGTETRVKYLNENESIEELARLLSTSEKTEAALSAAKEMKRAMRT